MTVFMVYTKDDIEKLKEFLADCPNELKHVLEFIANNNDSIYPIRVEHPNDTTHKR